MAISLSADEFVQMPLDALALRTLRDVDETDEWNSYNWMNAQQHYRIGEALIVLDCGRAPGDGLE